MDNTVPFTKFWFYNMKGSSKNFLWTSRLWISRWYESILGYLNLSLKIGGKWNWVAIWLKFQRAAKCHEIKKGTQNTHLRNNLTISFRIFKSSTFISKNVTVLKFTKPRGLENIKYYSEKLANTKCYISTRIKWTSVNNVKYCNLKCSIFTNRKWSNVNVKYCILKAAAMRSFDCNKPWQLEKS